MENNKFNIQDCIGQMRTIDALSMMSKMKIGDDAYKIQIKKNPNGDTRTCDKNVQFFDATMASKDHISEVSEAINVFNNYLISRRLCHDCDKITYDGAKEFYGTMRDTLDNGANFVDSEWYKAHIRFHRHHLNSRIPEDVNLIDVLEMIADCVTAGLARSGEIRNDFVNISDETLRLAFNNTIKLLADHCVVQDSSKEINNESSN